MNTQLVLSIFLIGLQGSLVQSTKYDPTWDSLDSRPIPQWYDDAKVGIFIHWGVFSVPSFSSEWFWYRWISDDGFEGDKVRHFMKKNYPPNFTYQDFARQFTAELFDPYDWIDLFQKSGAKYVVLTTKHHEGYTMWPSKHSFGWNSMDVGPQKDLVGTLASFVKNNTDLHFGLYHSLYEWYNPLYIQDSEANFATNDFVQSKTMPELYELVNIYNPELIWSDGDNGPDDYWQSKEFLAWLYNDSPVKDTVVVNDRWGGTICQHGGYLTCSDRYSPDVLQPRKWENALTIDKRSWGYRREATLVDYATTYELLEMLVQTVSCGGNILINVGPTKEGTISPIFADRLVALGNWLAVNGEAIYKSRPYTYQNDTITPRLWYTARPDLDRVYLTMLNYPEVGVPLEVANRNNLYNDNIELRLLGAENESLSWSYNDANGSVLIKMPERIPANTMYAWTLKIMNKTLSAN